MDFLRGPDDAKCDRALRRHEQPIPGFILEAEPEELAQAVDVVAVLAAVVRVLALDLATVRATLAQDPVRIKVMPGSDIEHVAFALGTTTGLPGACRAQALFLPPRTILVTRLDWPGVLAHELTHLVQGLFGRALDEREARSVEDQIG